MSIHGGMCLGRIAPSSEQIAKAPKLQRYMTRRLPTAPPEFHGADGAPIGMWGNDSKGDCTFAALANTWAICSKREGMSFDASTEAVIKAYLAFTQGQDIGAIEHDVLALGQSTGVDLGGSQPWKIAAWVAVNLADREMVRSLVSVFWSVYLGVQLPIAAQNQDTWDVSYGPDAEAGSWGGHALLYAGYQPDKTIELVTWGAVKLATPAWLATYADQGYVLLDANRASALGVDWDALVADLAMAAAA